MSRTVALASFVLCLLTALPVVCLGETYEYWQITVDANGGASSPFKLPPVQAATAPSKAQPLLVTPKVSDTAAEYRILRVPTVTPAPPTVEVVNKGNDTVYYWLVAHAALLRSPMAGPAIAQGCDAKNLKNIVRWPKTEPYTEYTVLRTTTPAPPAGIMQVLRLWGSPVTEFIDTNGTRLSHDYPCYPQGTVVGSAPIGNGPFLVGISKGPMAKAVDAAAVNAPVSDTGELKMIDVPPTRLISEMQISKSLDRDTINAVNATNDGALMLNITNNQPLGKYNFGGPMGLYVNQRDVAGGHNDYGLFGGSPLQKSFHIPLRVDQYNYTAGQMASFVIFGGKYGEGDNVLFTTHTTSEGLTEDGGDEGTEIFMASANLKRVAGDYELAADATRYSTRLSVKTIKQVSIGTGRPVVNLTQAVSTGAIIRIDDDMVVDPTIPQNVAANRVTRLTGEGTAFTKEMEGWYISLDCDSLDNGLRQWYRVTRVNSPTSLDIYAYTFFSGSTYLGHAANVVYHGEKYRGGIKTEPRPKPDPKSAKDGKERYLLVPATTIGEYPTPSGGSQLTVLPLARPWSKGDKLQVVAGPQTNLSLGKFGIGGNLLPQDFAYGFWIHNDTNRLSNDPAFYIMGAWRSAVKMELDARGLSNGMEFLGKANPDGGIFVSSPDNTLLRVTGVPIVLGSSSKDGEWVFAKGRHDGEKVVGISDTSLTLGENVSLKGGGMLRGRVRFSGDGKMTSFTIKFPKAYRMTPYIVAGSNMPIGMGVSKVTAEQCTVTFAAAPPTGQDNVEVTWMIME
ncbi:MAG: hypothetical protein ACYDBB_11915 [Armatimonadota bacterium]